MIELTVNSASSEFGVSRETVLRGLKALGIETAPAKAYPIRQLISATFGDIKSERAGLLKAKRIAQERENAVAEGRLHDLAAIEKCIWQDWLLPLKNEFEQLPDKLAAMLVQQDVVTIHTLLTKAVEDIKQQIINTNLGKVEQP